ncbi:SLBB domain-containing protein [Nevskia soli]|uniref:SLBB domain-containing protein n=1 Tax=Nevskia soli TaxID=418856 RepID=UPI00068F9CDC|nr:SLBB domain-containing protein [Nevskia soli]
MIKQFEKSRMPAVWFLTVGLMLAGISCQASAAPSPATEPEVTGPESASAVGGDTNATFKLGVGDAVSIQVYGRPEFSTITYVSPDGTISVPLAGSVKAAGLPPAEAAQRVAAALRGGNFLVDPQVTVFLVQYRSQQVSVLGEVRSPSRFPIESKTTILDLLAQAGGITEGGADTIYLLRPDKDGRIQHIPIDIKRLTSSASSLPAVTVRGGDAVFVPRAAQFYIYGEVQSPNMYRLEPGMTVVQAIARSGGITPRGSDGRIEIRRRTGEGSYVTLKPELTDPVEANDVLRVKERIF